jgi:hypothetical protein
MSNDKIAYTGPSWEDLVASAHSKTFTPTKGNREPVFLKVTSVGNFRSGSVFFVDATKRGDKTKVSMMGHCPHLPEQPAVYELM